MVRCSRAHIASFVCSTRLNDMDALLKVGGRKYCIITVCKAVKGRVGTSCFLDVLTNSACPWRGGTGGSIQEAGNMYLRFVCKRQLEDPRLQIFRCALGCTTAFCWCLRIEPCGEGNRSFSFDCLCRDVPSFFSFFLPIDSIKKTPKGLHPVGSQHIHSGAQPHLRRGSGATLQRSARARGYPTGAVGD